MGLYQEAAEIIRKVRAKKASVKTLVLSKSSYPNKKQLYALVCETIKHSDILRRVEEKVGILQKEALFQKDENLLDVLLYDQLIGRGIKGSHNYRIPVQRYRSLLKTEYKRLKEEATSNGIVGNKALTIELPRYVRVNLLKTSTETVIGSFQEEGWKLKDSDMSTNKFSDIVKSLVKDEFLQDPDLGDLLIFPARTDLHDHPLVISGEIILQDKASCFPAHILSPPEGASVIDSCAAPGNKTSHLASIMGNSGRIFAFDKSLKRLDTMKSLLSKAGVTCAQTHHEDFLRVRVNDASYSDVQYILVDPSCSGSGMVNRLEIANDDSKDQDRLKSLSNFQASILKHALEFPAVKRVVYSTCSIHEEENEMVVEEVMSQVKGQFSLQEVKPDWPHRGVKGYPCSKDCIRMSPDQDLTNGFFVACFEKIPNENGKNSTAELETVAERTDASNELNNEESSTSIKVKKHKKKKKRKESDDRELKADLKESNEHFHDTRVIQEEEMPKENLEKRRKMGSENPCLMGNNIITSDSTIETASPVKRKKKKRKTHENIDCDNSLSDAVLENCEVTKESRDDEKVSGKDQNTIIHVISSDIKKKKKHKKKHKTSR